jgi:hypothetical protein
MLLARPSNDKKKVIDDTTFRIRHMICQLQKLSMIADGDNQSSEGKNYCPMVIL